MDPEHWIDSKSHRTRSWRVEMQGKERVSGLNVILIPYRKMDDNLSAKIG